MNILLIFPPITLEERYGRRVDGVGGVLPPLGLAYIAAVLEKHGHEVAIIDCPALQLTSEELIKDVVRKNPNIIGISAMTPTFHRAQRAAKMIKEACPEATIVLGGPHASLFPRQTLAENPDIDVVCVGEGEYTLLEVTRALERGDSLHGTEGVAFRSDSQIIQNPPRPFIEDLDNLPFPARHLLPMDKYRPLPNQYKRLPVVHMICSRGCPFGCTYCSNAIFGRKNRIRSPENVVAEIKHINSKYGAREVQFWDDTFTLRKSWVRKLCNLLIEETPNITWTCETRVDVVDKGLIEIMSKAGCWKIGYGAESGDRELLDLIKKDITLDQIRDAVRWTKEAGMEVGLSFMLALPGETPEKALRTIEFAKELDPDFVQFCVTTPYPGTELYNQAKDHGTLIQDFSSYTIWNPVFIPRGYRDAEEILDMQRRAFRSFYYRPTYFIRRLLKIRSFQDVRRNIEGLKVISKFSS